jgi:hypothetical protein
MKSMSSKGPAADYNNPIDLPVAVGRGGESLVPGERCDGRDPSKTRRLDDLTSELSTTKALLQTAHSELRFTYTTLGMQAVWLSVSAMFVRSAFRSPPEINFSAKYFSNRRLCQFLSAYGLVGTGVFTSSALMLPGDVQYFLTVREAADELQQKHDGIRDARLALMKELKMDVRPMNE